MIRPYQPEDKNLLLDLLRLNTPKYFASSEAADFIEYLDVHMEYYFVYELAGQMVAGGGYNLLHTEKTARISWDLVHPDFQGQGIGKALTNFRIEAIRQEFGIEKIEVRTSQLAFSFYEKLGFKLLHTKADYWAPGFDLYHMELGSAL